MLSGEGEIHAGACVASVALSFLIKTHNDDLQEASGYAVQFAMTCAPMDFQQITFISPKDISYAYTTILV